MTGDGFARFVTDDARERGDLDSLAIEFTAIERGLQVDRFNASTVLVHTSSGTLPFVGMSGPDSSFVGKWLCDHASGYETALTRQGLPVASATLFPATQPTRALHFAKRLGWPVTLRPNLQTRRAGRVRGLRTEDEFVATWQDIVKGLRPKDPARNRLIRVEKHVAGETYDVIVVGDRVVAAVDSTGMERIPAPPYAELATSAVRAVPGLHYARVEITTGDITMASGDDGGVVSNMTFSPALVIGSDALEISLRVAEAIVDYYLDAPRWEAARQVSHAQRTV